jgi:hypothetical protein
VLERKRPEQDPARLHLFQRANAQDCTQRPSEAGKALQKWTAFLPSGLRCGCGPVVLFPEFGFFFFGGFPLSVKGVAIPGVRLSVTRCLTAMFRSFSYDTPQDFRGVSHSQEIVVAPLRQDQWGRILNNS